MRRKHEWDRSQVASRAWTRSERRVVLRGWLGRFTIAIEQLILGLFFLALPIGLVLRKEDFAIWVAPIFAVAGIAFFTYAIILMIPCTRAVLETFSPIYLVDGYIRYRKTYTPMSPDPQGYVGVLNSDRKVLAEWPMPQWARDMDDRQLQPALVEFSPFGGIHKIDGHPTGVLPVEIAPLGIGVSKEAERRNTKGSDKSR